MNKTLTLIGLLLLVIGCVVAYINLGMTRDQLNNDDSINQIFYDYFVRYGIAFGFGIVGAVLIGFGLKR